MSRAYVVRTTEYSGEPIPGVFEELQAGRARIGWSYRDDLDLRKIQEKLKQGSPLNGDEQAAQRCLGFLTKPALDDYLLYPHQPTRRKFCVVQVKGEYDYSAAEDSLNGDFRSFRPCSLMTSKPVDMYDEIVPSQLRRSLGIQGRFYGISDTSPLSIFLEDLPEAGRTQGDSNRTSLLRINKELREKLPDALRREFSRDDLSRKFCPDLFDRMGYSYVLQEGPSECGSDLVVSIGSPFLLDSVDIRIGVQVFAYEGTVEESALQCKLDQLLKGWETNCLDYGVLLTTGLCSDEAKEALDRHNKNDKNEPNRLVNLIDGNDLADLFLKYFLPAADEYPKAR